MRIKLEIGISWIEVRRRDNKRVMERIVLSISVSKGILTVGSACKSPTDQIATLVRNQEAHDYLPSLPVPDS